MYRPRNRTSWDRYMLNGISKHKFQDMSQLVRLRGKHTAHTLCSAHCTDSKTRNTLVQSQHLGKWEKFWFIFELPNEIMQQYHMIWAGECQNIFLFSLQSKWPAVVVIIKSTLNAKLPSIVCQVCLSCKKTRNARWVVPVCPRLSWSGLEGYMISSYVRYVRILKVIIVGQVGRPDT